MQEEELFGTVEAVTFHNPENGFTVLTLAGSDGELVTVVGALAGGMPGEELQLTGRYIEHAQYGRQFEAASVRYLMPEGEEAVYKYLASGALPGIGPATAGRIVEKFGAASLEVLATAPEKLAAIRGFSREKAQKAAGHFRQVFGMREAVASLTGLGLSIQEAMAAYKQYGALALDAVERNPFCLCGAPLHLSFARADAIAARLGFESESGERTRAALIYTLRHNLMNGHTCLPRARMLETACGFFRIEPQQAEEELAAAVEEGTLCEVSYGDVAYVYLAEPFRAEMTAALRLRGLCAVPPAEQDGIERGIIAWEAAQGIRYAPLQKQAITTALTHHAAVITGGPGTGKTTAVNAIIGLFEQQAERVMLAAPTGRAAKRLAELTGRKAATIHRLLEVEFGAGDVLRFARNDKNPLRCDVLIVDEMSMVDCLLFDSLLEALRPGCRLVMVGDADQLPSVGAGNVLRGIIESGVVPVVALKDIFRQAAKSLIVSNAHRIVEGQPPQPGDKQGDWFFLPAVDDGCRELICQLAARRLPASYGFSPLADIQVLCPGRRGPAGTEALNEALQQLINPPAPDKPELRRPGAVFRLGDKVMQQRNNYDIPFTRDDGTPGAGAFNGDIGFIEEIDPKAGRMVVRCDDRRVDYASENLHELEIAYATTIHKSQGSEFEAVILALSAVPPQLRYRNLLYTGVTRAKRLCVLVGEEDILMQMVRAGKKNRRYSCFADFLQDEALL